MAKAINKDGVQIGDVFYDSWGWEQTNVDFYQVVAIKGKTQVLLKAVSHEAKQTAWCQADVRPVKDRFLTGNRYITRQQRDDAGIVRRTGRCGDRITAGSGSDVLFLTTWDAWHHETSYY